MSNWKVIAAHEDTNNVLNPSGEIAGNFAAAGGATVTRVTTYQKFGLYSYRVQTSSNNDGVTFTLKALANAAHYVTVHVRGTLPAAWDWSLDNATYTAPAELLDLDGDWSIYGLAFPAAQANGSTTLRIYQNGAGSGDFYVDGIDVVEGSAWGTHIDGDQDGCEWLGISHASASRRSGASRAGGLIKDLKTDYNLGVVDHAGTGADPIRLAIDQYSQLPGGKLNAIAEAPRPFTLYGILKPIGGAGCLHELRQRLRALLRHDAVPKTATGWQPIRLWYTGAGVVKEIAAHYESGLEANLKLDNRIHENVPLRFVAEDPNWYEIGNSAAELDTNDSATLRYVTGRLRSSGQWSDLGLTANPNAGGTIYAVRYNPVNRKVYFAGSFVGFNGRAGWDAIVAYDLATATWERVGGASDITGVIYAMDIAPNGDVYVGGSHLSVAIGNYLAYYDISAGTWSSVGAGGTGAVYAVCVGLDGYLYAGGDFVNWNGNGAADYIVVWTGSAYAALGSGMNGIVYGLSTRKTDGHILATGAFTTAGGGAAVYYAEWNPDPGVAAWSALDNTFGEPGFCVAVDDSGMAYFGYGVGGASGGVVVWNGAAFTIIGESDDIVYGIAVTRNRSVVAVGAFTSMEEIAIVDRIAFWNKSAWAHLDVDIPGSPTIRGIAVTEPDPVLTTNYYSIFVGGSTTGTGYFAGDASVANAGTGRAFTRIAFKRSGGTTATVKTVRNETWGRWLFISYSLLDEETLVIDLTSQRKPILSSFFGPRNDAVLACSDVNAFALGPGANVITVFVETTGSPTVTGWLEWRDTYDGCD